MDEHVLPCTLAQQHRYVPPSGGYVLRPPCGKLLALEHPDVLQLQLHLPFSSAEHHLLLICALQNPPVVFGGVEVLEHHLLSHHGLQALELGYRPVYQLVRAPERCLGVAKVACRCPHAGNEPLHITAIYE
nr:hypothetical protein [Methermicoccus shengliensis]